MTIFLPVAGVTINVLVLVGTGALAGLLSGLLGVGGGFLATPILMMIGIPPTVAAASDTSAIVATSSSGMAAHFRLGNVDMKLGVVLVLGGLMGAALGVQAIKLFRLLGNADLVIIFTYIVVLGSLGGFMFVESLQSLRRGTMVPKPRARRGSSRWLSRLPFQMQFPRSGVRHSIFVPVALCSLVGMLSAVMGVGGGFITVPMMVYLLRMPMHVAIGTDLFQILFTCAGVTLMQATTNHTVDLALALLIAIGSTIGAQVGSRLSRLLHGDHLKFLLAVIVLAVMLQMAIGVVRTPTHLLSYAKGH